MPPFDPRIIERLTTINIIVQLFRKIIDFETLIYIIILKMLIE